MNAVPVSVWTFTLPTCANMRTSSSTSAERLYWLVAGPPRLPRLEWASMASSKLRLTTSSSERRQMDPFDHGAQTEEF